MYITHAKGVVFDEKEGQFSMRINRMKPTVKPHYCILQKLKFLGFIKETY